jgi:hypothetical protein
MSQNLRERTYKELLDSVNSEYKESCEATSQSAVGISLLDFIGRVHPSSNLDTTTAIIYYKTLFEGSSAVGLDDIHTAYSDLQRTPPANLVQTLRELSSVKYGNRIVFKGGLASLAEEGHRFIKEQLDNYDNNSRFDESEIS